MGLLRILYFGDGPWAVQSLEKLLAQGHQILGVVLRVKPTDPQLEAISKAHHLPIYQPKRVNAPEFLAEIDALSPELNLSVSYDQILRRKIIESAPLGFVNVHAGKLPYYRGRNVINWAIINGETEIGLTAHYVDEGIDTGDIIAQHTIPVGWTDTYGEVLVRAANAFPDLVLDAVEQIASGHVQPQSQTHMMGTYFARRGEGDEWLNWSDTSRNLHNKIRAITHPGPGARTMLNGQQVIVWKAFYDLEWPNYIATPGQVVGRKKDEGVWVKTGDSTLLVQEMQIENTPPAIPNWAIGTRLNPQCNNYYLKH